MHSTMPCTYFCMFYKFHRFWEQSIQFVDMITGICRLSTKQRSCFPIHIKIGFLILALRTSIGLPIQIHYLSYFSLVLICGSYFLSPTVSTSITILPFLSSILSLQASFTIYFPFSFQCPFWSLIFLWVITKLLWTHFPLLFSLAWSLCVKYKAGQPPGAWQQAQILSI